MLRRVVHQPRLQEWYDTLTPLVTEARERLWEVKPAKLVIRSGCTQEQNNVFRLTFFCRDYLVCSPDFTVQRADTGERPSSFIQALILSYLVTADGTIPSNRWLAFRDLPDETFYAQAFEGYAENRLVRELGGEGLEAFRQSAEKLRGEPIEIGGAGYAFTVLPQIHLATVY